MAKSTTPSSKTAQTNVILPNSSLTVTIPWPTIAPVYQKVLTKAATTVKADGFRLGKVPVHIAEKLIKPEALYEEVANQVLSPAYQDALKTAKKTPISQPEVEPKELGKDKDWVFEIFFAEAQPLELGKYQGVVTTAKKEAAKEITDKTAELVKHAAEHKDASHPHPTELTTEQKDDISLKHIFKQLVETLQPKVQEILVTAEVNREVRRLVDQLTQLNLKVEDYLRSRQVTAEQLQQEYAAVALSSLQIEFVLGAIAKEQKLAVEETEIDAALDAQGKGMSDAQKHDAQYRSYVFSMLLKQKVIKYLLSL